MNHSPFDKRPPEALAALLAFLLVLMAVIL